MKSNETWKRVTADASRKARGKEKGKEKKRKRRKKKDASNAGKIDRVGDAINLATAASHQ